MRQVTAALLIVALSKFFATAQPATAASGSLASAETPAASTDLTDRISLASGETVLTFDRRTGDVAGLVHRPTGQEFLAPNREPIFTITLVDPATARFGAAGPSWSKAGSPHAREIAAEEVTVEAHAFRRSELQEEGPGRLQWVFGDHPNYDLSAAVTAQADDGGSIRFNLSVRNDTKLAVRRILFPRICWSARLGDQISDDRLLLPFSDGQLLSAPGRANGFGEADYPGLASVQFAAYYDRQAGVYLAAEDAGGCYKRWQRDTVAGRHVAVNLLHLFEETPGNDVRIGYDVVLRTFAGDWRDAAALYKSWSVRQPWCAKKLADRTDVPAFLKEGSGVLIVPGFQDTEQTAARFGRDLEKLPGFVQAYRERTGLAHIIFVPYGWESRGAWAGINYFPARPSDEAWSKTARRLRKDGNRLMFMPSGFWWVVKRRQVGLGPAFDDSDQLDRYRPMLIKNPDGTPWSLDYYDLTPRPRQIWRGLSMHLCHGSQAARAKMKDIFLRAAGLGVSVVSFDQEQGGSQQAPCYDPSHGHGGGFGQYVWDGFRRTCESILAEGKPAYPELCLCLEDTCEPAIPWMGTCWSRQFKGGFNEGVPLPGAYPNSAGIFAYLYHEYVTMIGAACVQGQGDRASRPPAEVRCFILSNNLCRGLIPGPFAHDVPLEPTDEWHNKVSRAYFSYCQPYARFPEYLALGQAMRPPKVNAQTVVCPVGATAGPRAATRTASRPVPPAQFPAVNAGSFRAADGSVATVLANTTDERQSAGLVFSARCQTLTLYDAARQELQHWADLPAGQEITLDLEPLATRVLIAR